MPRSFDQRDIEESIEYAKGLSAAFHSIETTWLLTGGVNSIRGNIAERTQKVSRQSFADHMPDNNRS